MVNYLQCILFSNKTIRQSNNSVIVKIPLAIPYLPVFLRLEYKHLITVLNDGTSLLSFFQKKCFFGIIKQIKKKMFGCECLVRNRRCLDHVGKHTQRGGINDEIMILYNFSSELFIR